MVLAAGNSQRIASVAGGIPKPLLAVRGEPVIARNIRWLADSGIRRVWVNLHYRGDLIRAALGDGSAFGVEIRYSEEPEILGTAGAVRRVLPDLDETALVVYGDNLLNFDLADFRRAHEQAGADVTIAVFDQHTPNTGIAGGRVLLDGGGRVVEFLEGATRRSADPPSLVNAGVYAIRTALLRDFPEHTFLDWGRDVLPGLVSSGSRVFGHVIEGYCLGLDTPGSYERGMALIRSGSVRLR
ncbi:MAG: nucleotidyltransferase family protein [Gemmatimonadetes bacterium]|nr:nucleotidyltransferase family protein [Gemmatimonadota bacterium]